MGSEETENKVLGSVDASRRAFLKKLILGSAFVVPAVASFSMSGLGVEEAHAKVPNQGQHTQPGTPGQPDCHGQTVAYLAQLGPGGLADWAQDHGISVQDAQDMARDYCAG